jgi:hypothetical protein
MDQKKIMIVLRRAGLRLVQGNTQATMSDKVLDKSLFLKEKIGYDLLCNPKSQIPNNNNDIPKSDKTANKLPGSVLAVQPPRTMASTPISNAGSIIIPDENDIPNEYEFEILRLRRRIDELETAVRNRDERNLRAITMLEDELQMWNTFMHDHVEETHDGIRRRILRLDSTLMTLRENNSRFLSPLDLPERWRKS